MTDVNAGLQPEEVCARLAAWSEVTGQGILNVVKSDLLGRLIYGREMPSKTPCPVHKGRWSGCHFGWPGSVQRRLDPQAGQVTEKPAEVTPQLQQWRDDGCRCSMHRGSSCTTGWNPDEACGCVEAVPA